MSYEHNISKFYIFTFISSFFLLGPIIILFFLEYIPFTQFGLVFGIGIIVAMIFEVPSGVWADRLGRKYLVAMGLFFASLEIFFIAYGKSFEYFLMAGALGGFGSAMMSGADTALLYDTLLITKREKESKKIYGRLKAIRYWAVVLAALIGAPLYIKYHALPLYINAAIMFFAAVFFLTMKEPPIKNRSVTIRSQIKTLKKSFQVVKSNISLRWFTSFKIFSGFSVWLFHDLLRSPYYTSIGYPIIVLGGITAIISLARSFFSWNAERIERKIGEKTTISLILIVPVFLFLLLGIINTRVALVFAIILYCIWSLQEVVTEVAMHEHMSSKERATTYSLFSFANSIMLFFGAIGIGYVAEMWSIKVAIFSLAIFGLISGSILISTRDSALSKH
ncbi:MFS transporter [Candidatus Woesearchaeota archaeon]|nr:MFS transporter [Candidatus Woesearchaeota archaeon]